MQRLEDATDAPLRTLGLTKVFEEGVVHGKGRVVAVKGLNMTVPKEAIYGFLGPNGAGKTTTIRMLVGLLKPTSGTASICGHTIHDDLREAQRCIGYMPDSVHRFPSMRAVEFLETLGEYSGLKRGVARGRALDMLSWAGLDDQSTLRTKVNRWSAGMQRKLLFLQAMLHKPEILVLDEPTANLDPSARRELLELLKRAVSGDLDRLWRATVFVSSHDLPEVQEIATNIGFLSRGELVAEGTQESLRRALSREEGGGVATFIVSGTNLTKIAKQIGEKLGATVSLTTDTRLIITTKRGDTLFGGLASILADHPDVTITNMTQEEKNLETLFLEMEKVVGTKKGRGK